MNYECLSKKHKQIIIWALCDVDDDIKIKPNVYTILLHNSYLKALGIINEV